ncbi:formate dehydrogenase subunit alpha [Pantoea sp. ICBG 828]|uniref:formate dehydrogenase subunit alpha n=1 Tax=unclassified Pantoea TaxID=2630326 RepID=UPI000CE565EA|nr:MULTISPECIES: formate dehydrogenase subunit alpha [unclassified Pantoea]NIG34029.1 formate dehydrogenase subunit alpha [Pantoea sp. Ap-959]PPC69053.1 formate dehydrogenase subunit alpha [Pantoea sp. ICBG 828]
MSEAQCTIIFNGERLSGTANQPLIDFLQEQGKKLPHVCYHPALPPLQTCDVCWVEVDGEAVRGCTLRSAEGLRVVSQSAVLQAAQQEGMDRILNRHELYCTVCEHNTGDCTLHNTVADMHIPIQYYPYQRKPDSKDHSNPFYTYDPDQCILCGRCVEACQNVEVNETLSIDYSADHPRVLWDGGTQIAGSSCVSCGHCVTVCPCNALLEKTMQPDAGPFTAMDEDLKRPLIDFVKSLENSIGMEPITGISLIDDALRKVEIKKTKTVCTYCGVGCSFEVWTRDRHILKIQPVADAPVNGISTCVKGKFGWDFVNSPNRLTTPLIRENGQFRPASWEEALQRVADGLRAVARQHGGNAIGFIGSSKASNEEAYLTQKIARLIFGTNNVDNSSRYCQNPATEGLFRTVGYGGDAGTLRDLQQTDLIITVGSNLAENHPVFASHIKQSHKHRGQKLLVVDPRRHEMAERADCYLRIRPGTDMVWASAMARYMFDHGYADEAFLRTRVNQVAEYRASLAPFTLEMASEVTGLSVAQLTEAAEMIGNAGSACLLWAMGITQHSHGADTSTALSNLLLVTGNYGRPGTGGYPMRGHNNVQGASDFGCLSNVYPGYEKVTDAQVREKWARAWGVAPEALSDEAGLDNFMMVEDAHKQRVRAMYIIGEETAFSDADSTKVHEAFSRLDFMVVQDIFMSRTAQFADVVLPGCPSLEKEGTFVNTERRIQHFSPAFAPLGDSRPDWQILTKVAARLGHHWHYPNPGAIMAEAAGIATLFAGVSYENLVGWQSQLWPVNADGSSTPLLYTERFAFPDGKARLYPLTWQPPMEAPDAQYDLLLNNGRMLEHFQSTNQTGQGGRIKSLSPNWFVEISPQLAQERQLQQGDWVELRSRRGSVEVPVVVTERMAGNVLFIPIHHGKPGVNGLTGEHHDPDVNTPAYKEIAVTMRKLAHAPQPHPIPLHNFRHGQRTPLDHLPVEQKWQQPEYRLPPEHVSHPEKS